MKGRSKVARHNPWRSVFAVVTAVAAWEAYARSGAGNSHLLPAPSVVGATLWTGLFEGQLLMDTFASVRRVLIGFAVAAFLGVSLGILCGIYDWLGDALRPLIGLLRSIPPIAWIPIALLWFGYGDPPAYFLVGLGAFFPIFTNTALGLSQVERGAVEVALCHGARKSLLLRRVIIPQALPAIYTGIRTGLGVAWMVVITAELVGAQSGLGYMIQVSRAQLQADKVVAGMVLIGIVGYGLAWLLSFLEQYVIPWHYRGRALLPES